VKNSNFQQGNYTPKNPNKYVGKVEKIRFMSSWELEMHKFLDNNPNIIRWASEEIAIPYYNPVKQRMARYYPDYWIEYRDKKGRIKQNVIEVKPKKQTRPSRSRNEKTKLYENLSYAINAAKWEACQKWCTERGIEFRIITETEIFK